MAISVVQRASGQDNATGTVTATFGGAVTAGNAIIVIAGVDNALTNLGIVHDNAPNQYGKVAPIYQASMNVGFNAWIAYNAQATTPTVSCTDNNNIASLFLYEVAGLASSSAYDNLAGTASQQITGTACASPNITNTYANTLLLGIFGTEDVTSFPYTVGAESVNIQTQALASWSSAVEEHIVSATGAQSSTAGGPSGQISQCAIIGFADTPTPARRILNPPVGAGTNLHDSPNLRPHSFSPGMGR